MMDMKEFISLPLFPLLCGFGCSEFCWLVFVLSREFTTYSCSDGSYKKNIVSPTWTSSRLHFAQNKCSWVWETFDDLFIIFCAALDAVVVVLLLLVCEQPTNQPTIWSRSTWNAIIGVMFLLLFQLTRRMF